jgi:hypothetical protein
LTIVKNDVFANQDYGGLNQDELARILLLVKTLFIDKNVQAMTIDALTIRLFALKQAQRGRRI